LSFCKELRNICLYELKKIVYRGTCREISERVTIEFPAVSAILALFTISWFKV